MSAEILVVNDEPTKPPITPEFRPPEAVERLSSAREIGSTAPRRGRKQPLVIDAARWHPPRCHAVEAMPRNSAAATASAAPSKSASAAPSGSASAAPKLLPPKPPPYPRSNEPPLPRPGKPLCPSSPPEKPGVKERSAWLVAICRWLPSCLAAASRLRLAGTGPGAAR